MKRFLTLLIVMFVTTISFGLDVWHQKSAVPAVGRHRGTAVAIGDRGYVGLGHMNGTGVNIQYDDWWEFDPATNSWTQKASYPVVNYAASVFSIDYDAYVGGGIAFGGEFYKYSRVNNTWTQIATCPVSPADETAFTLDGKGFVLSDGSTYQYTPDTDTWTVKANCPATSWSLTSFVIQDKAYVKSSNSLYEYKLLTDTWTIRASFPGFSTGGSAAFSVNNKGYIVCGYGGGLGNVNSEVWEFNPVKNEWLQVEDFYGISRRFCVGFNINNKGYVTTGTNGTNMNDFWEFDPALFGVGIEESNLVKVNTFPNPSTNTITFTISELTSELSVSLFIYNNSGQLVKTEKNMSSNFKIFKSDFASGTYHYTVSTNKKVLKNGTFIFN